MSTNARRDRVYFTDRNLGKQFPAILLGAGVSVERHGDHFPPDAADEDWIRTVSRRGWVVLTHDRRIRYKVNERAAVMDNGVAMLVLIGAVPYADLARSFVTLLPRIETFLDQTTPPFIGKVYRPTPAELRRNPAAVGRVEVWVQG